MLEFPNGDGDGPVAPARYTEGVGKKFQMTDFIIPYKISSIKYALKLVPDFADVGVLHGDGD